MSYHTDRVRLADAISGLRREIRTAAERAQALNPNERFRITEAELELTTVAEDNVEGAAELGWWVLKGKAQASAKDINTQKVRLKLNLGDVEVGSVERTK
jgi:Trypsin-co-occurring domain 2